MNAPRCCERIVCLTEEPTEILYLLGEEQRIVGISAYTVRPPEARRDKPVVSAFVDGSVEKIRALQPDLVVGFSDIQANLAAKLIADGLQVLIFNQRTLDDILGVVLSLGRLVGAEARALDLVADLSHRIDAARTATAQMPRAKVYFEEWPDPMISCIHWVSEIIEIAGGDDIFHDRARQSLAKDRIVEADAVRDANPDVILASWCGKPFEREVLSARPGWHSISALANDRVHEVDPSIILQPGPACILAGLPELTRLIQTGSNP